MKLLRMLTLGLFTVSMGALALNASTSEHNTDMEKLTLTTQWDKTFPKSDKVDHSKVSFVNRYGITLAADMYKPKGATGKLPAIAVCGPFGAVKEQCAGLYAQEMAERGFLTVAFDPSFTGESAGTPRYMTSPDINTEDFSAAVDFLVTNPDVDPAKVGIIGICGWGGLAVNEPCRRNRERCYDSPWREGPLVLFRKRHLQKADRGSRQRQQQALHGDSRRKPYRPLRQEGYHPLRLNRAIL